MKRTACTFAALIVSFFISSAWAGIGVGDSVISVAYKAADGTDVSIASLKGKLVLIDFWATWCGPCMAEAPHMVSINSKYSAKGLVVLGISLDRDATAMVDGAKKANLNWPQVMDGGKFAGMFGVDSIPRTFLVGPDGKVLWTGHPAGGLDAAIEDAFKNHPPFLVDPALLANASKLLDEVEQMISSNNVLGAMKSLVKVPPTVNGDEKFATRSRAVQQKLEAAAEAVLADAGKSAAAGNYIEALKTMREMADGLATLPVGVKAKKQMTDLLAKPEMKAALVKAEHDAREAQRDAVAAVGIVAAEKFKAEGKHAQAFSRFKQVIAEYAGTPSAATAAEQVQWYNKEHPELAKNEKDAAISARAKAMLTMAEGYKNSNTFELAKAKYRAVIENFPGTTYAATAKKELEKMGP